MSVERKKQSPKVWQDITPKMPTTARKKKRTFSISLKKMRIRLTRIAIWARRMLWPASKKRRIILLLIILIGIGFLIWFTLLRSSSNIEIRNPEFISTYTVDQLTKGTPDHNTVLPKGKTIDQLGGWTRVSPAKTDPVYAYLDTLSGITIRVSEQRIPDAFKDDVADQIKSLAEGFNATQKVMVGGTVVYLDQPSEGPQSVIFAKNNILISIRSSAVLETGLWVNYISSLE